MNPYRFIHHHPIFDGHKRFSRDHSTKCKYLQSSLYGVQKPARHWYIVSAGFLLHLVHFRKNFRFVEWSRKTFRDYLNAVSGTETDADSKRFRIHPGSLCIFSRAASTNGVTYLLCTAS